MKRFFVIFLATIVILESFSGVFLPRTPVVPEAKAAVGTWEFNPAVLSPTLHTDITATGSFLQQLLEWGRKLLLETFKKKLLDAIVDQIIAWIQGEGEPKFITDFGGFIGDTANQAIGDFVSQDLGLEFLCKPFKLQFQIALGRFAFPQHDKFSKVSECTLDKIVDNIEDFYDDFRNGGNPLTGEGSWFVFAESLKPQNDLFQVTLNGELLAAYRYQDAQSASFLETIVGDGFLGTKNCDVNDRGERVCFTTTPGAAVGNMLSKAVGSDIDYILSAQDIEAYATAIVDAIGNRLIGAGDFGILGVSTNNSPDGGTFAGDDTDGCENLPPELQDQCEQYQGQSDEEFNGNVQSMLDQVGASLDPRRQADTIYQSALNEFNSYQGQVTGRLTDFDSRDNAFAGGPVIPNGDDIGDLAPGSRSVYPSFSSPFLGDYNFCDLADFSGTTCVSSARCNKNEVKKIKFGEDGIPDGLGGIQGEIAWAGAKITEVTARKDANLQAIARLTRARDALDNLLNDPPTDAVGRPLSKDEARALFTQYINDLRGILDPNAAQQEKFDAENYLDEARVARTTTLKTIDQRLKYCNGTERTRT